MSGHDPQIPPLVRADCADCAKDAVPPVSPPVSDEDCGVCERPFADHEPGECAMSLRELCNWLGWPS